MMLQTTVLLRTVLSGLTNTLATAPQSEEEKRARVVKESSDSGVELKQAAESVATANGPALGT